MIIHPNANQNPPQNPQQSYRPPPETKRLTPNFLTAFEQYGEDNFTPPEFNTWTGISIIAGALERKVWLQWNATLRYYPNLFVMLVSLPGQGKSTALNRGVRLLEKLYKDSRRVNFLPSQITEAKMIELMETHGTFLHRGVPTKHCSSYYFASEASNSLKEVYGDITTTMTDLYDCPDFWEKATMKGGKITIHNGCLNLLAGSTMQYLGQLINDSNVLGGFASRIDYILAGSKEAKKVLFPTGETAEKDEEAAMAEAILVNDLKAINEMTGPFSSTQEFREAWSEWDYTFQRQRLSASSEKLQSLMVRMGTSMHKLCMVLSAAASSDRVLRLEHLERAKFLLSETQRKLPTVFREARSNNISSNDGIKNSILLFFERKSEVTRKELTKNLIMRGHDARKVEATIHAMSMNGVFRSRGESLELLINPNDHL